MAMTIRTTDNEEQTLTRLATRWGLSKQQAILRAVREADRRETGLDEVELLTEQVMVEYADALTALADR